ncbi:MAG TPA: hypothetical protein DCZ95_16640 [Verrucomicrobia bacterium]|nr:hypothetical protein [Verrucomicrobiota bacterium]
MNDPRQMGNCFSVFFHPLSRASSLRCVGLWALVWALAFAAYSSFLHEVFRSSSLDMALHSQLLRNLAQGQFMRTSFLLHSFAANHIWPGLYLLAPIHQWLGIHGLLALQCLVVASGALAAYELSRDITNSEAWGRAFGLAYLLQPTLSAGVLFDYHLELFSVPFALFALLGLRRHRLWFWPCMMLSWCFYEINAAVFFFLGVGLLFRPHRRRIGCLLAVSSLTYLAIVFFVLMPHFRGSLAVPHWERYAHLGNTPAGAIATVLAHPFQTLADGAAVKALGQLRYLFIALGCLSFFSLKHLLPAVPLLLALVLSQCSMNSDVRFGYVAPALPFLLLSAAHGAAALERRSDRRKRFLRTRGPYVLAACSVLLFAYFQIEEPLRSEPFRLRPNLAELRQARDLIPPAAGLSADNHLGAHFADRDILLVTPATRYGSHAVEFVLTDLNETEFKDPHWWVSMRKLLAGGNFGPVFLSRDVLLLQRGIRNEALTELALNRMAEQTLLAQEKAR